MLETKNKMTRVKRVTRRLCTSPLKRSGINGSASKKSLTQAMAQDIAVEIRQAIEDTRAALGLDEDGSLHGTSSSGSVRRLEVFSIVFGR